MTTIRTLITGSAVVAAGAAAAATLAATGTASAGTPASSGSFTLRVHHGADQRIDLGKAGFSAGDQDLVVAPVTRNGRPAGHLVGSCTTARVAKSADQLCEFVLRLRAGQITASGTFRAGPSGPGTFTLPILGGTGDFQGAGGQISVTSTSGGSFPIEVTLD